MGRPAFLAENVLNRLIFPSHVLTASETEAGTDVANLGTGRRQRELSRWSSTSLNTEAWVQVAFDRVRVFNFAFIDRGHNLGGHTAAIRVSSDGFTTYTEIGPYTIPSQVFPYARLADGRPILTEEGAVLWYLGEHGGKQVRVNIPAMGSGLKPELVNVMIGMWFQPEHAQVKPFDFGKRELTYKEIVSPQAQAGAGEVGSRAVGEIHLKLASRDEYALVRYHLEQLAFRRKPMVIVHDDEEAEKSIVAYVPPGRHGFAIEPGNWSEFQGRFPYHENEPEIV